MNLFLSNIVLVSLSLWPVTATQTSVEEVVQQEITLSPETEIVLDKKEINCLAVNMYHEARGESTEGQLAVAFVTLNRMESKSYPDSVCGVVYQGRHKPSWKDEAILVPIRWRCQFSWYCDGKPDIVRDTDLFNEMVHLSIDVWRGRHEDMTDGSLFYHADYVQPSWAKSMVMVTQIDRHMFYRMAN